MGDFTWGLPITREVIEVNQRRAWVCINEYATERILPDLDEVRRGPNLSQGKYRRSTIPRAAGKSSSTEEYIERSVRSEGHLRLPERAGGGAARKSLHPRFRAVDAGTSRSPQARGAASNNARQNGFTFIAVLPPRPRKARVSPGVPLMGRWQWGTPQREAISNWFEGEKSKLDVTVRPRGRFGRGVWW